MTPRKWLYFEKLPTTGHRDWIPSDLSGTTYWYNAQDASSYTLTDQGSGSAIDLATWNAQGGSGTLDNTVYDGGTITLISGGLNGFDAFQCQAAQSSISTSINPSFAADITLACVFENPTGDLNGVLMGNDYAQMRFDSSPTNSISFASDVLRRQSPPMALSTITAPHFAIWTYDATAQTLTGSIDGEILVTATTPQTIPFGAGSTLKLFNRHNNTGNAGQMANLIIGEAVFTNMVLSTSDIDQLNGYLAWNWSLEGNLPASHPYKLAPPQI